MTYIAPLDIERLLTPIPGDHAAGRSLVNSDLYDDIRRDRRRAQDQLIAQHSMGQLTRRLEGMSPDEQWRRTQVESAIHWVGFESATADLSQVLESICARLESALIDQSKDLQLAAWLVEARTQRYGFAGAAPALRLIADLTAGYGDTLHPLPEPDDEEPYERRIKLFDWLADTLPTLLCEVPLTEPDAISPCTVSRFELARRPRVADQFDREPEETLETFMKAMTACRVDHLTSLADSIRTCREEASRLESVLQTTSAANWTDGGGRAFTYRWPARRCLEVLDLCQMVLDRAVKLKQVEQTESRVSLNRILPPSEPPRERSALEAARDYTLSSRAHLASAITGVTLALDALPEARELHVILFELLCLQGDFESADRQLRRLSDACAILTTRPPAVYGDILAAETIAAADSYRERFAAERQRRDVFHGGALPRFLLPPPAYVDDQLRLIKTLQSGGSARAARLVEPAEAATPAIPGELLTYVHRSLTEDYQADRGTTRFAHLRDADDRLGSVLEAYLGPTYAWVPFTQIASLSVTRPKPRLDRLWLAARLQTVDKVEHDVIIPAVYVDTALHEDDGVRSGRLSVWDALEDRLVCGAGERHWLIDDRQVAISDVGTLTMTTAS